MTMTVANKDTAIQQQGLAPGVTLRNFLNSPGVMKRLAEAAGKVMKPDDMVRLTLMAASRNQDLFRCSQDSIVRALLDAATLGVKPGGLLGRGYLVPRFNGKLQIHECSFDPGWRGLVDIARRSGVLKRIEAHVAFRDEKFVVRMAPFTTIEHEPRPDLTPEQTKYDCIVAAYAVAELTDGATQVEVVWKRDLDKIKNVSKAKSGPWFDWPGEQARKSAVRRLCKYLPFEPESDMGRAIEMSDRSDQVIDVDGEEMTPSEPPKTATEQASSIAERVRQRSAPAAQPQEADPETGEIPMTDEERAAAIERGEA